MSKEEQDELRNRIKNLNSEKYNLYKLYKFVVRRNFGNLKKAREIWIIQESEIKSRKEQKMSQDFLDI